MTPMKVILTLTLALAMGGCSLFQRSPRSEPSALNQAVRLRGAESVAVNRYLWAATFDTLSFLPVQQADPFTGVIITGFGRPPGGGRAYRATIHISDPALDARSLNVSLVSSAGAVPTETVRAVEDAILTRARQIRIADGRL